MKRAKELIMAQLLTLHSRVSNQRSKPPEQFPYLVVDYGSFIDDGEIQRTGLVEVDAWDQGDDTNAIEDLVETVNAGLNKRTLIGDGLTVTLYLDSILSLTDNDQRIRRRKLVYQAHVYGRS